MPDGHWRAYHAVARTGLILASLGQLAAANPGHHSPGTRPTGAPSHQHPQTGPSPSEATAIHSDTQRIAVALEAKNRYDQSAKAQQDAHNAAEAAGQAARSAGAMFWAALAETLITAAGVYLVYRTLREAKRSADAAAEAAKEMKSASKAATDTLAHARKSAEQELRAYVFVYETELEITKLKHKGSMVNSITQTLRVPTGRVSYSYKNTGKTPAKNVYIAARAAWIDSGALLDINNVGDLRLIGPLGPGAQFSDDLLPDGAATFPNIKIKDAAESRKHELHLWGRIEYDDEFSKERRWTTFHCYIGGPTIGYDETLHAVEPGNDYR